MSENSFKHNENTERIDGIDGIEPTEAMESAKSAAETEADDNLEERLNAAFEMMDPTEEQQQRMLAALQKAQAERAAQPAQPAQAERATQATQPAQAAQAAQPTQPAQAPASQASPRRTGGFRIWKAALPIAACLVVGAVVIGVANWNTNTNAGPANTTAASQQSNSNVATSTSDGKTEATADDARGESANMYVMGSAAEGEAYEGDVEIVDWYDYDPFNTEEYSPIEERGFVSTKTSPLSTVSADVDTASYANLRRMINNGSSLKDIPVGAVRIEEMLNYFDYDYASPRGNELFSMQAQTAKCPWNDDTQLLVLGFATAPESQAASKGSNLVFLVDVSGSMNDPDKLSLLQDSFATLVDHLDANDRISIVTYASGEEIVLEGASGDDKNELIRAIYKLHAGGATNGQAGLAQAYEVAERNYIQGGVNRIIMASDGDLNVGMTSTSDLHDYVDKKRENGIYLSVLGFGAGNYKDTKMETLADHGNGSYHYIDSIEEAEHVLVDKLDANLVPFADDVKIQVEFNPAQVKGYRLIGYENRAIADEDFRNDAVDAGDVGPSSQFTVAYEVVLADSPMSIPEADLKYGNSASSTSSASSAAADSSKRSSNNNDDWLTCTMRYHAFDGDEMREQELVVDGQNAAKTTDDWNFAAAVIEFGMLARNSQYAGTSSIDSVLNLLTATDLNAQRESFMHLVQKARS